MVFDVLQVDGRNVSLPYAKRRMILEELNLNGRCWRTPEVFDDGDALWEAVCEHELEGVIAKGRSSRYVPGGRGWIKTKNRDYWRYEMEREGALNRRCAAVRLEAAGAERPVGSCTAASVPLVGCLDGLPEEFAVSCRVIDVSAERDRRGSAVRGDDGSLARHLGPKRGLEPDGNQQR